MLRYSLIQEAFLLSLQADAEQHTLAKYLMELTLIDYDMVHIRPSEIASAALCLAQKVIAQGSWVSCICI